MQLDRTHVAIRVRTLSEIGDLSLVMIRRYPKAFFQAFFLGAAFWIVADMLLLGWLPLNSTDPDAFGDDWNGEQFRYLFWMATLVFLQAPIAGSLTTYMLGQSIFEQQIPLRRAVREVRPVYWRLIRVLGIRRLAIPAMLVVGFRWYSESNVFFDFIVPASLLLLAAMIRSSRPFVAEMILLERCPLRSKQPDVITLGRRSQALHSPMASELGARFLAVAIALTVLLSCVFFALLWSRGVAGGNWSADAIALLVFYPLALWLIASLSVVIRLLGYLDARIRLEGWEVELAIRAEAIRQFGEDAMSVVSPPVSSSADQHRLPQTSATPADSASVPASSAAVGTSARTVKRLAIWAVFVVASIASALPLLAAPPSAPASPRAVATRTVGAEASPVADSPWFDSTQQALRPIELHDDRIDTENRDSRWLPKSAVPKPSTSPPAASWSSTAGLGYFIGWLMLIFIVGALVASLMYVFSNSAFDFRSESTTQSVVSGRAMDEQTKQRIAELPAELRDTTVSPRTEIERLMDSDDFDRAIIFLYGHQLLMLDRVGWLRLSRWKTNHQYLRETQHSDRSVGDQFGATVAAFERSYFGKHGLSRSQFEHLWQQNLAMEATLSAHGVQK